VRELGVYVWWSAGRGDGDGYDETIEVTEEQYEILKEDTPNYDFSFKIIIVGNPGKI